MNTPPASANAPADTSAKFPLQFRICARPIFSIKEKENFASVFRPQEFGRGFRNFGAAGGVGGEE